MERKKSWTPHPETFDEYKERLRRLEKRVEYVRAGFFRARAKPDPESKEEPLY